jgi:hypothetical protein
MALTKAAVEPLLGFLTKVTAVRVAGRQNPALAKPLPEQVRAHGMQGRVRMRGAGMGPGVDALHARQAEVEGPQYTART